MDETTTPTADRPYRGSRRRIVAGAGATALAMVAALAAQRAAWAQAVGGGPGPGGHGVHGCDGGPGGMGPMHGPMHGFGMDFGMGPGGDADPAVAARRLDAMVAFRLAEVDATAEQRARISAIVQSLAKDMHGTREKMMQLRQESVELLGAAAIDRARLERVRAERIALIDGSSKRLLQAMMDGAEVLTPSQRATLLERQERGRHRHRRSTPDATPPARDVPKK